MRRDISSRRASLIIRPFSSKECVALGETLTQMKILTHHRWWLWADLLMNAVLSSSRCGRGLDTFGWENKTLKNVQTHQSSCAGSVFQNPARTLHPFSLYTPDIIRSNLHLDFWCQTWNIMSIFKHLNLSHPRHGRARDTAIYQSFTKSNFCRVSEGTM